MTNGARRTIDLCFRTLIEFWTFCFSEYQEIDRDATWCDDCRDLHKRGVVCPRYLRVWCQDCLCFRTSDRAGNCGVCGSRSCIRQQARAKQHVLRVVRGEK